ncbi:MAG: alcohol dehydrogenase catalytic domain-containing protein, partial [Kiritimatiellae bacterium]|nr:alcohol dehydrogenase catalytic domain-containing protein [Kiritimatiellia bacterium]
MKAIAKVAPKKGVELVEKPMPEMGINDVLIKIKKTAICGTDVHIYEWNSWAQEEIKPPLTIGHEYVGEVVEVGSNVKSVKVGERVSGEGHIVCGHCRNCRAGQRHLCRE